MVIVDSSVWIDYFQGHGSDNDERLESLIRDNNRAVICGIILQEILQGIKDNKGFEITKQRMVKLPFLDMGKEIYLQASVLYKRLRAKGITIPPVDAAIAALAIHNDLPLFTNDGHFKKIAKYSELRLY